MKLRYEGPMPVLPLGGYGTVKMGEEFEIEDELGKEHLATAGRHKFVVIEPAAEPEEPIEETPPPEEKAAEKKAKKKAAKKKTSRKKR